MKIVSIHTRNGEEYTVGLVLPQQAVVADILYCRDGYSGGSKGKFPSYAVKYENTTNVVVIPETKVEKYVVTVEAKQTKNTEAAVELPD